jgi:hypothetical protein
MDDALTHARELLAGGDAAGLIRHLRLHREDFPLAETAQFVSGAGSLAGFDDLVQAADAVVAGESAGGSSPQALYDYGCACLDRGIEHQAIRPLRRALEMVPTSGGVLGALAAALENDGQHAQTVAVLEAHEAVMDWSHRFQHVYNAIMAGDLATAAESLRLLPEPDDDAWAPARTKVRQMLARADVAQPVTTLATTDLRGWHYVLTGAILEGLSPYGFDQGMTGRWAYTSDSVGACRETLRRVALILTASGARPRAVSLLPDRSSRILGLAAAQVLGLPSVEFTDEGPTADRLVVAYDLNDTDPEITAALRERVPGQILLERATCWTDPPRAAADISGFLAQTAVAPWAPRLRKMDDGSVGETPADERPVHEIADEIAHAAPEPDEGDGSTPADPDDALTAFVTAVAGASSTRGESSDRGDGRWLTGIREYVPDSGPVPSSRFL